MRRRIARVAATISLVALLTGCITTRPFDTDRVRTPYRAPNDARQHEHTRPMALDRTVLAQEKKYTITRITIPTNEGDSETIVDYYRAKVSGPRPLMLLSPPLGTSRAGEKLTVERPFLTYFAKNGWDAALIYRPRIDRTQDALGDLERGMELSVREYRHAIDHLVEMPDVRTDRLCALGISMGGIITAIAAAEDSRIRYTVLALAGSTDKVVENVDDRNPEGFLRKLAKTMDAHGGKPQFIEAFRKRVPTQPQNYAHKLHPADVMLIISKRDKIIPRDAAEDLRERAGYPKTRYIHLLGHVGSFLLYPVLRHEIMEFFDDRISTADAKERSAPQPATEGQLVSRSHEPRQ